jgi:pyridoxine 5'-phosphate synthase PdxJ
MEDIVALSNTYCKKKCQAVKVGDHVRAGHHMALKNIQSFLIAFNFRLVNDGIKTLTNIWVTSCE